VALNWLAKKRLKRLVEANRELFNRKVFDNDWQCPYCGGIAAAGVTDANRLDKIEEHLAVCPRAGDLEGDCYSPQQLDRMVTHYRIDRQLATDPAWLVWDLAGSWICPYCSAPAGVFPQGPERLSYVLKHLASCYEYKNGQAPVTAESLRSRIDNEQRQRRALDQVRTMVKTHAVLRFMDNERRWVCPFCEKAISAIDMSTPILAESVAPDMIARHLLGDGCTARQHQFKLRKTEADMEALVEKINIERQSEAPAVEQTRRGDTGVVAAMRAEQEAGRTEAARHSKERQAAAAAQARMLPKQAPALPGYEIAFRFQPSEEVSGDFVDLQLLDPNALSVGIGDVSGHGLAAGMVMSMARKAMALRARSGASPAAVLTKLNADILPDVEEGMFVTALHGVLDAESHTFTFARAGHNAPVVIEPGDPPREVATSGMSMGLVLGERFSAILEESIFPMPPGAICLLYTDGLSEAKSANGAEYGVKRLLAAAAAMRNANSIDAFLDGLLMSVKAFAQGQPFEDDITLIGIRRK
jgi:serine phosphatase RsbU (regulator of sigma subunit)